MKSDTRRRYSSQSGEFENSIEPLPYFERFKSRVPRLDNASDAAINRRISPNDSYISLSVHCAGTNIGTHK